MTHATKTKGWLLLTSALCSLVAGAAQAQTAPAPTALPQGGQVVAGQANITSSAAQMTVNQSTNAAVINWNSFNVGAQAGVTFNQPDTSSRTLNRVLSSDPSQIYGTVKANGQLFFVNPNGVIVGKGARIEAGAVVASTLDTTNEDFINGDNRFNRAAAQGKVVNEGSITAAPEGYIALIGAKVENKGTLSAPQGQVALAAGDRVRLPVTSSGLIGIEMEAATVQANITNDSTGLITAADGRVFIKAEAAGNLGAQVVNKGRITAREAQVQSGGGGSFFVDQNSRVSANKIDVDVSVLTGSGTFEMLGSAGEIRLKAGYLSLAGAVRADSATGTGGRVILQADSALMLSNTSSVTANGATGGSITAQATRGNAILSGKVEAKGTAGRGGQIEITGATSAALLAAQIDASGALGGGLIHIGGGWQGAGPLQRPEKVMADQNTVIRADALQNGAGGEVVLWSSQETSFFGKIYAQGGVAGGQGGRAEISSAGTVKVRLKAGEGITLLARKAGYSSGTLLIDPADIVIGDMPDVLDLFKKLVSPVLSKDALFGASLALTDDYALIGAPGGLLADVGLGAPVEGLAYGNAYLYRFSTGTWTDLSTTTGQPVTSLAKDSLFAMSLALNGTYALIGAPGVNTKRGNAYLYNLATGSWTDLALVGGSPVSSLIDNSSFGMSVALNSHYAAIAGDAQANGRGDAWLYNLTSGSWLDLSTTAGNPISGLDAGSMFGTRMALSETHLLVSAVVLMGSPGNAYVYNLTTGSWLDLSTTAGNPIGTLDSKASFGASLTLSGQTALISAPGLSSGRGNAWFYDLGTGAWTDLSTMPGELVSSLDSMSGFGSDVALTDQYALIGSFFIENGRGGAFLINRTTGAWTDLAKTLGNPIRVLNKFKAVSGTDALIGLALVGTDVALNNRYALIGAPGLSVFVGGAYTYDLQTGAWAPLVSGRTVTISQPDDLSPDPGPDSFFGTGLALNDTYAVIGAPGLSRSNAYLYNLSTGAWLDLSTTAGQPITALSYGDSFGETVALNDTYALFGAPYVASHRGNAYLYNLTTGAWTDLALTAGEPVTGINAYAYFGDAVALSGTYAVIGARRYYDGTDYRGNVYLYHLGTGAWTDLGATAGSPVQAATALEFGRAVAINGSVVLIGGSDQAYLYNLTTSSWTDLALTAGAPAMGGDFGGAVALNGLYALIGATTYYDGTNNTGNAYLYNLDTGSWVDLAATPGQKVSITTGFGQSLALNSTYALVGSSGNAFLYNLSTGAWQELLGVSSAAEFGLIDPASLNFGESVALSESYALIGAPLQLSQRGNAFLYNLSTHEWKRLLLTLSTSMTTIIDLAFKDGGHGMVTSVNNAYALIGTPFSNSARGNAWLYNIQAGTWLDLSTTSGQPITELPTLSFFGSAADLNDTYALIGASQTSFLGFALLGGSASEELMEQGGAYLYNLKTGAWLSLKETAGAPSVGGFGTNVSLNGSYALITALTIANPSNMTGLNGGAYLYNLATGSWLDLGATVGAPITAVGADDYLFAAKAKLSDDYVFLSNLKGVYEEYDIDGNYVDQWHDFVTMHLYNLASGSWSEIDLSGPLPAGLELGASALSLDINNTHLGFAANGNALLYEIGTGTWTNLLTVSGTPITGTVGYGLAMNDNWAMISEITGAPGSEAYDLHFYNMKTGAWKTLADTTGQPVSFQGVSGIFLPSCDMSDRYVVIGLPYSPLFAGGGGSMADLFAEAGQVYLLDADYILKTVITTADIAAGLAGGNMTIVADNSLSIHNLGLTNANAASTLSLYSGGWIYIDGPTSFGGREVTLLANAASSLLGDASARKSGAADLTVTPFATITNTGALTRLMIASAAESERTGAYALAGDFLLEGYLGGGRLFVRGDESAIDLSGNYTLTGSGTAATFVGLSQNFTGGTLQTTAGRWLVYNTNAASLGTVAGLSGRSFNRYGCTYDGGCAAGVAVPSAGHGVLYAYAPTVTIGLASVSKVYDGSPVVTLSGAALSGFVNGDSYSLIATFDSAEVGTNIPVTYRLSVHAGYLLTGGPATGTILERPRTTETPALSRLVTEGLSGFEKQVSPYDLYVLDLRNYGLKGMTAAQDTRLMLLPMEKLSLGVPLATVLSYQDSGVTRVASVAGGEGSLPEHLLYDTQRGRLRSRKMDRIDRIEMDVRTRSGQPVAMTGLLVPTYGKAP